MPTITAKTDVANCQRWLDKKVIRQLPYIRSLTVNRTAKIVKTGVLQIMKQRFDRPTTYTMNSLFIKASDRKDANPESKVYFKDDAFKGTPATKFLTPGMYGGIRHHKRFEKALIAKGLMKSDKFALPASGAQMDSHGNVKRGQIVQILSALKAFGEGGYMANRTASRRSTKKGAASNYFVGNPDGQGEGIWRRKAFASGSGVQPVFIFAKQPRYRVIVPFDKITENMAKKHLPIEFNRAFNEAMATAR